MKKYSIILVAVLFVLFAGCGIIGMKEHKVQKVKEVSGKVTINFTLTRIGGIASNQYAVWIEDETGKFVRTLFVTDYMARRQGWKVRQQSLTTWVKAADVKNTPQEKIDSVSAATPKSGNQSVVWDMKDITGKTVAPGIYIYKIEGSLFWEKTVLWTGKIQVGVTEEKSQATVSYFPEGTDKFGKILISDVNAVYEQTKQSNN